MRQSLLQTWNEAKKEPVFTMLYIGGVAFAIAFVMVYAIVFYVRAASIYPEYDRTRTVSLGSVTVKLSDIMMKNSPCGWFANKYFKDMDGFDLMAVTKRLNKYVQPSENADEISVVTQSVNPDFFELFRYKFVQGKPFDEAQMASEQKIAIITDNLAQEVFGTSDDILGRDISIESEPWRVVGVVREGSSIASDSYAQIFLPNPMDTSPWASDEITKAMNGDQIYFRLKPGYEIGDLQKQMDAIAQQLLVSESEGKPEGERYTEFVLGPLESVTLKALGPLVDEVTWTNIIKQHLWVLLILLIIPAINISGMIGAQMERKVSEIGIRRSFGATKWALTRQVMLENLYLTLGGGLLGLILAWIFVICAQGWIFDMLDDSWNSMTGMPKNLSADMLFAPGIFLITLAICIVLNLASAYIPVRWTLRKQVVDYINDNK